MLSTVNKSSLYPVRIDIADGNHQELVEVCSLRGITSHQFRISLYTLFNVIEFLQQLSIR